MPKKFMTVKTKLIFFCNSRMQMSRRKNCFDLVKYLASLPQK